MSFATDIKNEVSDLILSKSESIAELSGFIRNNARFSKDLIELNTENMNVCKKMYLLLKKIYGIDPKIVTTINQAFNKNNIYWIKIEDKVDLILKDLCVCDENYHDLDVVSEYLVDDDSLKKAYIRGAFCAKGSINDPKTSRYHLEFLFDKKYESVFVQRLLNNFDLNAKILLRDTKYMVYIKEAEKISDFLKIIGASKAVLYYENIRAFREQKNITNRLNNCEQANIEKIIETANKQIKDIELIKDMVGLDLLDEKTQEAAQYRIKYPEVSLQELSEIITIETGKTITKSGLNHRFRKIRSIAKNLLDNNKNN